MSDQESGEHMQKKKKILIVVGIILVLLIIGGLSSQPGKQNSADDSTAQTTTETDSSTESKEPAVKIDAMLDDIKIDSYTVDNDGVVLNITYNSSDKNWVCCEVTRFEYNGKTSYMKYDSEQDKYLAEGVEFEQNGEPCIMGLFTLRGGEKATLKFTVDSFSEVRDYNDFAIYCNLKYSGTFSGEIKNDYVKVQVS